MLSQSVVQILSDPPLFPRADLENRLLECLALGDVDAGSDDVRTEPSFPVSTVLDQEMSLRSPLPGHPVAFVVAGSMSCSQLLEDRLEALDSSGIRNSSQTCFPWTSSKCIRSSARRRD